MNFVCAATLKSRTSTLYKVFSVKLSQYPFSRDESSERLLQAALENHWRRPWKEERKATASRAAANEINVDAAVEADLLKLDAILVLKEELKPAMKALSIINPLVALAWV